MWAGLVSVRRLRTKNFEIDWESDLLWPDLLLDKPLSFFRLNFFYLYCVEKLSDSSGRLNIFIIIIISCYLYGPSNRITAMVVCKFQVQKSWDSLYKTINFSFFLSRQFPIGLLDSTNSIFLTIKQNVWRFEKVNKPSMSGILQVKLLASGSNT